MCITLIFVVVEDGLVHAEIKFLVERGYVLILVVVEDGLAPVNGV